MKEWPQVEDVVRRAFDGLFLEFSESIEIGPDQQTLVTLSHVSVDSETTEGVRSGGPYAREIAATLHWLARRADAQRTGEALDAAYHRAQELTDRIPGSDVTGVDRGGQEAEPHVENDEYLLGTEIWIFRN